MSQRDFRSRQWLLSAQPSSGEGVGYGGVAGRTRSQQLSFSPVVSQLLWSSEEMLFLWLLRPHPLRSEALGPGSQKGGRVLGEGLGREKETRATEPQRAPAEVPTLWDAPSHSPIRETENMKISAWLRSGTYPARSFFVVCVCV